MLDRTLNQSTRNMGSFVALHIRSQDIERLRAPISAWLASHGFDPAEQLSAAPLPEYGLGGTSKTASLGRLNAEWSILLFDGIQLGGKLIDDELPRPFAERVSERVVLFMAQTNSSLLQLVVFDGPSLVRSIMVGDGQSLTNEGARLPGERANALSFDHETEDDPPSPMEDAEAIRAAMGLPLWPELPLAGPVYVWKRKGLFARMLGK